MDENLIGKIINGSYELTGVIARGGMATVYKAHQISMNRDVAIKILPREFLHEPAFRERFKQEAAIAARLEHRAIVPVYDYGEWEGVPYIAMRLMPGRSLDHLIEQQPLNLERLQQIVRQIASALDYAHAQDVLHRDLKPSNILLDLNGDAYITDFGIARILSSNEKLTSTGVVGTPAYMSPEQAQGHPLDGRSDVYALGVVIFEALTGKRPFEGETPYSIAVMQVTKAPPSPRLFNPDIAPGVAAVVLRSLEKDPSRRYQTAIELAGALDDADLMPPLSETLPHQKPEITPFPQSTSHLQPTPPSGTTPVSYGIPQSYISTPFPRRRRASAWVFLGAAVGMAMVLAMVLLGVYILLFSPSERTSPDFAATAVVRLTATAGGRAAGASGVTLKEIIYVSNRAGQPDLYRLDLETSNVTRLTDTRGAEDFPAVSPDGSWLAYLYDPASPPGNDNSNIEIYLRRLDDSDFRQVTSNLVEEGAPVWTPDGDAILYTQAASDGDEFHLNRYDVLAETDETLYQFVGRPRRISLSPDGEKLVFAVGDDAATGEIVLLDLTSGDITPLTDNTVSDWDPCWHPDGTKIVFLRTGTGGASIMQMRADGTGQTQIFDGEGRESGAVYSLDGAFIIFSVPDENGDRILFRITADGLEPEQLTGRDAYNPVPIP